MPLWLPGVNTPPVFQACWERFKRADEHRKAHIEAWDNLKTEDIYGIAVRMDGDGAGIVTLKPKPLPYSFALQLGEMLYQLRAILDGAIYASAILEYGCDPPPDEDKWEFPIRNTEAGFKKARRKLGPLADEHVGSIVESVQPYTGSEQSESLRLLNDWARKDRHRTLHVVSAWHSGVELFLKVPAGCSVVNRSTVVTGFLDGEREIAKFQLSGYTPDMEVQADLNVFVDVGINERPAGIFKQRINVVFRDVCEVLERIVNSSMM